MAFNAFGQPGTRVLPQLLITAFTLLWLSLALAGPGIWTSNGPDGARISGLVASPDTANVFYAVSRGGVFKTLDGGVTWTEANAGINRQLNGTILHSNTAPNRLYVTGSRHLFFSNNGATSWQDRTPPDALLTGNITTAELSDAFPGRIYLGLASGDVLRSDNAGVSWISVLAIPQPTAFGIESIATHPVNADELLVATADSITGFGGDNRLFRGTAAGNAWVEIPCPMDCPWQEVALFDIEFAGNTGKLWAVNQEGVTRSLDFGNTWTPRFAFAVPGALDLAVSPVNIDQIYLAGGSGLAYTLDDGVSWTEITSGFTGNSALLPTQSSVVVYDPFNPLLQLAGSISNGVYRRTSTVLDVFQPGVDGFNATTIRAVTTTLGNRVHAGFGDSFSATFSNFRSTNNGLSWNQANSGLNADQLRDLTVDPNDIAVVYGGGRYLPKDDGTGTGTFVAGNGGIYKSLDGGVTWAISDNGIPLSPAPFSNSFFGTVRAITVDEFSCLSGPPCTSGPGNASQVLYAGGSGRLVDNGMGGFDTLSARIFKSTDAGANWVPMENGLGSAELSSAGFPLFPSVVQIVQDTTDTSGNTLYAATFIVGLEPGDTPTVIQNGVFKTTNGGMNWTHMSNGLPRINGDPTTTADTVLSLAFDPTDMTGNTLYASSNDISNGAIGSVYKTTDGGMNWVFAGTGLTNRDVRDLVVDPLTGDVYAAVTDPLSNGDGGIFVSTDGGASWSSISVGFPSSAIGLKLALDNTGPNLVIQAGTTRGIQSFEVLPDDEMDGATNQQEGAAPNNGDGNLDGVSDDSQANTASPTVNDPTRRGTQSYITASLTPIAGTCDRLENSFGLDLLQSVPVEQSYTMPFNGIYLRIPDCQQAELELIYHDADFDNGNYQMRSYGLDFPNTERNSWNALNSSLNNVTWVFQLTDGAIGDSTPQDNVIVFQGGAKTLREVFFIDGSEVE